MAKRTVVMATALWLVMACGVGARAQGPEVLLGDLGADMEVDAARQRLYVSVPSRNQIVVISTETYEIIERVTVGPGPRGIDISIDGSLLFVALDGASSVVFLDLETFNFSQVVIGAELGSPRAWDVIEGRPGRVFASANASSGGISYIVMINRDANNAAIRVADGKIIRARPVFASSPDRASVYVGEGFSPNSLYKLDISENPFSSSTVGRIILEDDHGSVYGTHELAVSPDGNIIYTANGQALRTGSFIQVGKVGAGVPRASDDGSLVYVAQAPDTISVYETTTYTLVGSITTPCTMSSIHAFDILPNGEDYVIQSDDIVCAGNLNEIEPQVLGHYAQIAAGQGFTSELVLTNPSVSRTATGTVVFRGDAGLPLPLNFGGVPLSEMSFSIPPLGTFSIETDGEGEIVSGSATVSSNLDLGGVVRFTFPGVGTAAVLEGTPLSNMVVPMRRSPDGLNTGLAIMNPGEDSVWVTLTLFDTAGVQVPSGTRMIPSLPAGGHIARFLDELFPDADTDDFHGSLVISTFQGSLVATALEIGVALGQFTAIPVLKLAD